MLNNAFLGRIDRMASVAHKHFARFMVVYLWALVALVVFGRYFMLTINVSPSLPGTLFLVQKGAIPKRGDLAAFKYAGGGPYLAGSLFLKRVSGTHGSMVSTTDIGMGYRNYFVDGGYVGVAKPKSTTGARLEPGPSGVIPLGRYYVSAPHPDSLDSRYALIGWVSEEQVVGVGIRIF